MIRLSFIGGSEMLVQEALKARAPQVRSNVMRTMDALMIKLQSTMQRKLTGEVLQSRTGQASNSVRFQSAQDSDGVITGKVAAGGGPAFYLVYHERGGTRAYEILPKNKRALAFAPTGSLAAGHGIVPVRRSVLKGLRYLSGSKRGALRPERYGKFAELGGVVVRRVIHPPLPARPFASTSLAEMRDDIISRLRDSVGRGLLGRE